MKRAMVRFGVPAEPLRSYVSTYYVVECASISPIEDLLPPEWGNLRYVLNGCWTVDAGVRHDDMADDPRLEATLYGPTSRAIHVRGHGMIAGVGLLPAGWSGFIKRSAHETADQVVPQAEVFGAAPVAKILAALRTVEDDRSLFSLLDAFLSARLDPRSASSQVVTLAHKALLDKDVSTVADFSEALGLSSRHIHRLCLRYFGFPPKLLLRRQRFLRTLSMQREQLNLPWSSLIDPLYYDQSHYIRDFHDFMGMSPTSYFALPRALLEPAARARVDLFGKPFQALHLA